MGRLVSRLVWDHPISWFDHEATISSSRPNFGWPLRRVAVKGGRRRLRSDLPLMATSAVADLLDRESRFCEPDSATIPRGARHQAQTCAANFYSADP